MISYKYEYIDFCMVLNDTTHTEEFFTQPILHQKYHFRRDDHALFKTSAPISVGRFEAPVNFGYHDMPQRLQCLNNSHS